MPQPCPSLANLAQHPPKAPPQTLKIYLRVDTTLDLMVYYLCNLPLIISPPEGLASTDPKLLFACLKLTYTAWAHRPQTITWCKVIFSLCLSPTYYNTTIGLRYRTTSDNILTSTIGLQYRTTSDNILTSTIGLRYSTTSGLHQ